MHQYKKLKGNEASNHKSSYKIVICQADIDVLSFSLNQFDKKKKKIISNPLCDHFNNYLCVHSLFKQLNHLYKSHN